MKTSAIFFLFATLPALVLAAPEMPDSRARANDAQLRHALDVIRLRHDVPGMAAALFDAEHLQLFAVGELAPGEGPVTPESRFRIGQVSLLFTALAAAVLTKDGSLPEQAELRRIAPELDLQNPWSGERPIRLPDLLENRAGIGAPRFRDVYTDSPEQPLLAGINRAFRALRLESRPGDIEHYSVVGQAVAAYLAEKATGMPYPDVIDRMIFRPLEFAATLGRAVGPVPGDSSGHAGWPPSAAAELPLNLSSTGDIWISAHDLAVLGRLLLNRGRLGERDMLPAGAVDWMENSGAPDAIVPGSRRGLEAEERDGFIFFTQTGATPGFLARFAYSRELGRGYLILLNHGDAAAALAETDVLLRGQLLDGRQPPAVPAAKQESALEHLAGWYVDATPDLAPRRFYTWWLGVMRADLCDDWLCVRAPGEQLRLEAFDANRLREEGHWYPGWRQEPGDDGMRLFRQGERWQSADAWQVFLRVLLAVFAAGGLIAALVLLPWWLADAFRQRRFNYHDLLPRFLPIAAMLSVAAFHVVLFTTGYPALGRVSTPAVSLLLLSLLAPVLTVCAVPAVVAAYRWRLPRDTAAAALYITLAAVVIVIGMAMQDLVAFQSWNY